jgi:hypothetical protein
VRISCQQAATPEMRISPHGAATPKVRISHKQAATPTDTTSKVRIFYKQTATPTKAEQCTRPFQSDSSTLQTQVASQAHSCLFLGGFSAPLILCCLGQQQRTRNCGHTAQRQHRGCELPAGRPPLLRCPLTGTPTRCVFPTSRPPLPSRFRPTSIVTWETTLNNSTCSQLAAKQRS